MTETDEGKFGKYFGVCPSFHHSKACECKHCSSYPGDGYMFCARGCDLPLPDKKECLCKGCYIYSQFAFEGDLFCRGDEG